MTMTIKNHGGKCCGVKHIHGFSYSPNVLVAALPACEVYHGAAGEMNNPGKAFHPSGLPTQKGHERLDALLKYLDEKKPSHLVEIILPVSWSTHWKKTLEDRGFKLVTSFVNCNTIANLDVYHRVTSKPVDKDYDDGEEIEDIDFDEDY